MKSLRQLTTYLLIVLLGTISLVANAQQGNRDEVVFFFNDALGSAVAAINEQGELCWSEEYTGYGDKTINDDLVSPVGCGIIGEERGFTGHTEDVNSDLVYMQQRYYDPSIGRFMSIDPMDADPENPMTHNRYAYANNNPYKYTDPDGREARLQTHTVGVYFQHAKIALIPDNQSKYQNDPRFPNKLPDGRVYATVGAGEVKGILTSELNRDRDVRQGSNVNNFDKELFDSEGRTDDELIDAILIAENSFDAKRYYELFPGPGSGYNSNSFISGIINFLGLSSSTSPDAAPGFNKPVPSSDFQSTPNPHP